jgi:diacylglycerol kinase (ATP)
MAAKLEQALGPYQWALTQSPGHATKLARQAVAAGHRTLVAIGGDGTVNEVVNGMLEVDRSVDPELSLGVIDAGTGGDFAKNIGLPKGVDAQIDVLREGHTQPVGLGLARFAGLDGEMTIRWFTVLCSFGISSAINGYVNAAPRLKRYGNSIAFALAAVHTIFTYKNALVKISIDGQPSLEGPILLSAACIGPHVGGGMKLAPDADLFSDGLDFMTGGDIKLTHRLNLFSRIYRGSHVGRKDVHSIKGKTLSAVDTGGQKTLVDIDGDVVGTLPVTVQSIPHALRVCCPK